MPSWVVEAQNRKFAGDQPTAVELAVSMLGGQLFAWLSERQVFYLRSLIMGEHFARTNERLEAQARAFPITIEGLGEYHMVCFFAPVRGLLTAREVAPQVISVAERVRLHAGLVEVLKRIGQSGEGAFEAQREIIREFREGHGDLMARVRALPFYDGADCPEPNDMAPIPYYLVTHQNWLFMERLYHAERLTERGFRVYRHGGTRRDSWKVVCVTTFEPKARDAYSELCRTAARGGARLVHPGGHVDEMFFAQGAESARQCA